MFDLDTLMILIPALPLAACIFTAIFGKHFLGARAHLPTVLAIVASFLCSLPVLFEVRRQADEHGSSLAPEHDGGAHDAGPRLRSAGNTRSICGAGCTSTTCWSDAAGRGRVGHAPGSRLPLALRRRRHAAGRSSDVDHADHGHLHRLAGGDLCGRLHARRPGLLAVLHLCQPVRLFDDDAGQRQQFRAAVRLLGSGRHVQLPASRLLVREAGGRGRRQEGLSGQSGRRLWLRPGPVLDLCHLRHLQFS